MRSHPSLLALGVLLGASVVAAQATCPGDCDDNGAVAVNELILGVNIALGAAAVDACPNMDTNGDDAVRVAELVNAVNRVLDDCTIAGTPTSTMPVTAPPATVTPTPTVTPTTALGPVITFFGLTSADDSPQPTPTAAPGGIPVFERPFGFGFSLVIESGGSTAKCPPPDNRPCEVGRSTFPDDDGPDLQVQVTRPLGDGSAAVCDDGGGDPPLFGGVPGVDPPVLDEPGAIVDQLNDLGCRFVDGVGNREVRTCGAQGGPCVRFVDGEFGCVAPGSQLQFCAPIPMPLEFPLGDTLVSARLRDVGGNLGPPAQIIVRIVP